MFHVRAHTPLTYVICMRAFLGTTWVPHISAKPSEVCLSRANNVLGRSDSAILGLIDI